MKIAYILIWDSGKIDGVLKKVIDQINALDKLGNEVKLFILSQLEYEFPSNINFEITRRGKSYKLLKSVNLLVSNVIKWNPNVCYLRMAFAYPALIRLAKTLPVFIEINTDDIEEFRLQGGRLKYYSHRVLKDALLSNAKGLIAVTNELKLRNLHHNKNIFVSANGIDLERFEESKNKHKGEENIANAVFIGTQNAILWHGIDKIILMAKHLDFVQFHIIGIEESEVESMQHNSMPPNLKLYGFQHFEEYEKLVCKMDVAISTLALHRKKMQEACPLKTREYLAIGLPTIIAYDDTDFPDEVDFILKLPNEENNIMPHLEKIKDFILSWKGKSIKSESIQHLSTFNKVKERMDFIISSIG